MTMNLIRKNGVTVLSGNDNSATGTNLAQQYTTDVTYETGRSDAPYLTVVLKAHVEGRDIDSKSITKDKVGWFREAVKSFQESREATRADAGYCGDFSMDPSPAMFSYVITKTYLFHTDRNRPFDSLAWVGPDQVDFAWREWEVFEEAVDAARTAVANLTPDDIGLSKLHV